jgi:hypothetical protein
VQGETSSETGFPCLNKWCHVRDAWLRECDSVPKRQSQRAKSGARVEDRLGRQLIRHCHFAYGIVEIMHPPTYVGYNYVTYIPLRHGLVVILGSENRGQDTEYA